MKKCVSLLVVTLAMLFLCTSVYAAYNPGTYTGTALGRKDKKHSGVIKVEVTVSASTIDNIKVVEYEQSVDHKKYGPLVNQVKDEIPAAIVAKQSLDVDGVTKATLASNGLQLAVARALAKATASYTPGTYTGTALGRKDKKHSGVIKVEVTVSANAIDNIKVVEYEQSVDHKKYGPLVNQAKDEISAAIVAKQSLDVDGVSGATLASDGLQLAVARALAQAR
nr:FMN-binding protein [uncultured Desulfuromonas sp.]